MSARETPWGFFVLLWIRFRSQRAHNHMRFLCRCQDLHLTGTIHLCDWNRRVIEAKEILYYLSMEDELGVPCSLMKKG